MRAVGLLALLIGVLALLAPTIRASLPAVLYTVDDNNFRIIGGCLLVLGAVALWFTREQD